MRRALLVIAIGSILVGLAEQAKLITWGEIRCLYNPRACLKK
jgi:hypothetical protein